MIAIAGFGVLGMAGGARAVNGTAAIRTQSCFEQEEFVLVQEAGLTGVNPSSPAVLGDSNLML